MPTLEDWKYRYENDPTVTLQQIADSTGLSKPAVVGRIMRLNWKSAKATAHAKLNAAILKYKSAYYSDPTLTVAIIADSVGAPYHVVRDKIKRMKWDVPQDVRLRRDLLGKRLGGLHSQHR